MKLKKIDAIIIVVLIVVSTLFLINAGYITPPIQPPITPPSGPDGNQTPPPPEIPSPPTSFLPSFRREVSPDDEGVHYNEIRIHREWWYFGAIFNDTTSELHNWGILVSFNHMATGDFLGTAKPDLLVVSLLSPTGENYGGMINKKRYLGVLNTGTLIASSPGVNVEFEDSWAEGQYPNWHVHAEDNDIDGSHEIIIDLDYHAFSLPLWTIGTRAFDQSDSSIANYLFTGCEVSGTVTLDGREHSVKGTGHHEHSWTPHIMTRAFVNGWDWFHITLENGWNVYLSNYYPTPEVLTSKTTRINPLGTLLITTDRGETITELKNVDIKLSRFDDTVFPFVKMPVDFTVTARPSINPLYAVSQALLYGTNIRFNSDISLVSSTNRIWKFPTYVGMKTGLCTLDGMLYWSDDDGEHSVTLQGTGVAWSMRALL